MVGPFPGMDPFLEEPGEWSDVHSRLITAISDALAARVAPDYIVRIEQRVYVTAADDPGARAARAAAIAPPTIVAPLDDLEVRDRFIEILDARNRAVVATLEVLSPANKTPGAFGREQFARKRRALLDRAEDLGRRLAEAAPPLVLCHADIHTGNVLLDAEGRVWIVDWDETILAPRERDLMFVVGGISSKLVGPREEALFFRGYGATDVDPLALAFYRYAWAVGDIGAFGEEVFFRPDLGPVTRRAAVDMLMGLFQPGEIVALALASDDSVP